MPHPTIPPSTVLSVGDRVIRNHDVYTIRGEQGHDGSMAGYENLNLVQPGQTGTVTSTPFDGVVLVRWDHSQRTHNIDATCLQPIQSGPINVGDRVVLDRPYQIGTMTTSLRNTANIGQTGTVDLIEAGGHIAQVSWDHIPGLSPRRINVACLRRDDTSSSHTFSVGDLIRRIPGVDHVTHPRGDVFNEAPDGAVGIVNSVADSLTPGTVGVQWEETGRQSRIHVSCIEPWRHRPQWHCSGCGRFQSGTDAGHREADERYCDNCVRYCYGCSRWRPTRRVTHDDFLHEDRCEDCRARCDDCGNELTEDDIVVTTRDGGTVHRHCAERCCSCDQWYGNGSGSLNWIEDHGGYACDYCSSYCDRHDDYHVGQCPHRLVNISEYGHTRGSIWLGGPVPRNDEGKPDSYYLGFELEITASSGDGDVIRSWADTHLGHFEAMDCKEDSSVAGFEIVTQPMTPEFFESVNWESFFDDINTEFPITGQESTEHGLHVHIGRVAFGRDPVATAAFCHLIGTGEHMERIGRRAPTSYCLKVDKPASVAIGQAKPGSKQGERIRYALGYPGRNAINLGNDATIEIRAFRSTRSANELRDAVRLVYLSAEYVRHLRATNTPMSAANLRWSTFSRWVALNHPEGFDSIVGLPAVKGSNRIKSNA